MAENPTAHAVAKDSNPIAAGLTGADPFDAARRLSANGAWHASIAAFAAAAATGAQPNPEAKLWLAIAHIRLEDEPTGIAALTVDLLREADGRRHLRQHVVGPLVRAGSLPVAISVLNLLVEAYPTLTDDHCLLASLLGRMKHWVEAVSHADQAAAIAPEDMNFQATCIQLRLQAGHIAAAAEIARNVSGVAHRAPRHAHLWITALLRDADTASAAHIAMEFAASEFPDERVASAAVQALLANGQVVDAIAAGQVALRSGHDGAVLRSHLAQAHLTQNTCEERTTAALEHLAAGLEFAPNDVRLNSLHGETLLHAGKYVEALPFLEKCCTLMPQLQQTRALYARALRHAGRYAEAANHFMQLVDSSPERLRWQRNAAAALSQAGCIEQASELFDSLVQVRAKALPATFEAGLAALSERRDTASITQARLDWAWSLRIGQDEVNRAQWEESARWGHLADHLLLDWLECRDERAEEAMALLADLDEIEHVLRSLHANGRGVVIATAHVGPMYAGPMVLELLGLPSRWLASTPSIARTHYAATLISTSDQTEQQIAKASLKALQTGHIVALAVDGAANPAAPRIPFEAQEITYSSFAARAAHRTGAPSVFFAPRWTQGRINFTLEMLPSLEPGEDVGVYAARWQQAYLSLLRIHLGGPPENLRMSGGLWRHVGQSSIQTKR